jgi:hypothetical protein
LQFRLAHCKERGGVSGNALQTVLDKFHTYHSVPRQYVPIGFLYQFSELIDSLVGLPIGCQTLFGVPLEDFTLFSCGNGGALSVYGDTAENGGIAVCLSFLSVDIE